MIIISKNGVLMLNCQIKTTKSTIVTTYHLFCWNCRPQCLQHACTWSDPLHTFYYRESSWVCHELSEGKKTMNKDFNQIDTILWWGINKVFQIITCSLKNETKQIKITATIRDHDLRDLGWSAVNQIITDRLLQLQWKKKVIFPTSNIFLSFSHSTRKVPITINTNYVLFLKLFALSLKTLICIV